jgi:biopolymer transport protein ExbD
VAIGRPSSRGMLCEINMTPFVDVTLVLLIIFLIASPVAVTGVGIDLPPAKAKPIPVQDNPRVLTVDKVGRLFIGDVELAEADLEAHLRALGAGAQDSVLFVRADASVPHGTVLAAMASAQRAGFHKLTLVGKPPRGGAPGKG